MSFSKAELDNLLDLISKGDISALKSDEFDQFQYQGFDPMKIVQSLLKAKKDNGVDDELFKKHVFQMIAIGIIKGSVNDKNLLKMSEEGRKDIEVLFKTYGIEKKGGKGKAASIITFPRVMATFPDVSVRMANVIGAKEFSGGPMLSSRLPTYLKVQVFSAVIPRSLEPMTKKMLMTANLCYTMDQSIQISELKTPDLKQLASNQGKFTLLGHQSPVPSDPTRKSVFNSLSVENDYTLIVEVLKDYKQKVDPSFIIQDEAAFKTSIVSLK